MKYDSLPTIELVRGVERGDPDAETAFFNRFFGILNRIAEARIRPKYAKARDGEDIALTSLRTFLRRARDGEYGSMTDPGHPRRLILQIAINRALNAVKYERRAVRDQDQTIGQSDAPADVGTFFDFLNFFSHDSIQEVDKERVQVEISEIIERAHETLTDRERLIFEMSADGKSHSEIAKEFDVDPSTIWRTLAAIRRRWQREFGES